MPRPGLCRTGMARCEFRFAKLMMSGPPVNEPKGGVPVVTCADTGLMAQTTTTTRKAKRRAWDMMWSPYVRLQRKRTGGQAAVEDDSLKLEVENQAIVQELLNVERNLNAVNSAVVRKADFDGNVETSVIVGMNVESYGGRQKRGGIEEEI